MSVVELADEKNSSMSSNQPTVIDDEKKMPSGLPGSRSSPEVLKLADEKNKKSHFPFKDDEAACCVWKVSFLLSLIGDEKVSSIKAFISEKQPLTGLENMETEVPLRFYWTKIIKRSIISRERGEERIACFAWMHTYRPWLK